ncbi:P-loop containing nucleoside triphosphate hydrolase protein, partial [Melampsora americana]
PPKQKKKTLKKSTNRGFATTSIPKKVTEPEPSLDIETKEDGLTANEGSQPINGSSVLLSVNPDQSGTSSDHGDKSKENTLGQDEWDLSPEDREIYSLAEKLRPTCEKAIAKQVKILEFDRRAAKGLLPFSWSNARLQEEVLDLTRNVNEEASVKSISPNESDDEEKLLQKVIVIYGVLEKLGYPKNRIEDCVVKIQKVELDEAMDYLLLHCTDEELIIAGHDGLYSKDRVSAIQEKDHTSSSANSSINLAKFGTGCTPDTSLDIDILSGLKLNDESPMTTKPFLGSLPVTPLTPATPILPVSLPCSPYELPADVKQKTLDYCNHHTEPTSDDLSIIEDYVSLRLSLIELCKKTPKIGTDHRKKNLKEAVKHAQEVKTIEEKIRLIQGRYTFDQREADEALKLRLQETKVSATNEANPLKNQSNSTDINQLDSAPELNQSSVSSFPITAFKTSYDSDSDSIQSDSFQRNEAHETSESPDATSQRVETGQVLISTPDGSIVLPPVLTLSDDDQPTSSKTLDEEGTSLFGSMFNDQSIDLSSNGTMPTSNAQTNTSDSHPNQQTVVVRDVSLPKHFVGKSPRSLLEECIRRLDKYVQPRYFVVSGGSRAVKASVEIKWQNSKMIAEYGGSINGSSPIYDKPVQTFIMEDEACPDEKQAYNYVATIALFHLNAHNPLSVQRSLPTVFRDLWNEFKDKRKKDDDKGYIEHLKSLMTLVKTRMSSLGSPNAEDRPCTKSDDNVLALVNEPTDSTTTTDFPFLEPTDMTLMEEFAMRQQWPTYQYMLRYRASLPIAVYRSSIIDTIEQNQVVVLCGETGCGKSTQLPAFILEHELSRGRAVKIFCTEPRRISAISLAQRVSQELGEPTGAVGQLGSLVGYHIRLESKTSPTTRLVYATTGIVLRMLENGTDLHDITHLIVDEVHERSIDGDCLLLALLTVLERRPTLRLILMSATVDAEKISNYMNGCPILKVPGRTFPVTSFFLEDVIELTGYELDKSSDSRYLSRQLKQKVITLKTSGMDDDPPTLDDDEDTLGNEDPSRLAHTYAKSTRDTLEVLDEHQINMDLILLLLEQICVHNPSLVQRFSNAILVFLPSLDTIRKLAEILESHPIFGTAAFQIFPLHSTISNENQGLVFQTPPPGVRKIVISTNIAETGITIPDVTCVIDSGKHREMRYDEKRQISRLVETFIARSNATQRKGRAGRVQEGICFHLFTKHRMETQFAENPLPEMLRLSLQDLALRIKIMKIGTSIKDVLRKALDPPSTVNVQRAIASLVEVKALTLNEDITPLGRHLVKLPMDVHMGKLLILGCLFRCLSPALTVAAALNSKSPFLTPFGREQEADTIKRSFKVENSDFLTICNVYNTWRNAFHNDNVHQFCRKNMLSHQNLMQIEELRIQFFGFLLDAGFICVQNDTRNYYGRSKFCTVPRDFDTNSQDTKVVMGCIAAAMFPKLLLRDNSSQLSQAHGAWRTMTNSAPASIHPSSVNFTSGRRPDFGDARFVTYFNIMQSKKLYVWESGVVDEKAIFLLCGEADFKLCAQAVILDSKIKASMNPKTLLSLKILRQRFQALFNQKMKNPSKPFSEKQQRWFDLIVAALKDEKDHMSGMFSDTHKDMGRSLKGEAPKKKTMTVVIARAGKDTKPTQ